MLGLCVGERYNINVYVHCSLVEMLFSNSSDIGGSLQTQG
jgi:hypothetical protein